MYYEGSIKINFWTYNAYRINFKGVFLSMHIQKISYYQNYNNNCNSLKKMNHTNNIKNHQNQVTFSGQDYGDDDFLNRSEELYNLSAECRIGSGNKTWREIWGIPIGKQKYPIYADEVESLEEEPYMKKDDKEDEETIDDDVDYEY